MTKEEARQEEREMFMEEIARLRKTIEQLEEERDAYKLMWERAAHRVDDLTAEAEREFLRKEWIRVKEDTRKNSIKYHNAIRSDQGRKEVCGEDQGNR